MKKVILFLATVILIIMLIGCILIGVFIAKDSYEESYSRKIIGRWHLSEKSIGYQWINDTLTTTKHPNSDSIFYDFKKHHKVDVVRFSNGDSTIETYSYKIIGDSIWVNDTVGLQIRLLWDSVMVQVMTDTFSVGNDIYVQKRISCYER